MKQRNAMVATALVWREQGGWTKIFLLVVVLGVAACSAGHPQAKDGLAVSTDDPFDDEFFTRSSTDEDWVWRQSESPATKPDEPEQPKTALEQGEGVVFSTLMVGASLAKLLAVPFLF
jgi:hypothetical protein